MASCKKKLSADSFKRDTLTAINYLSERLSSLESSSDENSSESDIELEFNNEDKTISLLYRKVVDDLMDFYKIRESAVNDAIQNMVEDIAHGHKNDFRKFQGINFCRPENCCGYLRRYAICYTGLVKKSMWNFFTDDRFSSKIATEEIVNKRHLRVVSLGGGPGNDLVGFCSALAEIPNSIKILELIITDINEGWKPVFPILLRKAKGTDWGSFSQCLEKKILTGFMEADLTSDKVYEDGTFSSVLGQADVLLMVKLTSFLCSEEADKLLENVIDSMKPESKLIYIDQRYDGHLLKKIENLHCIYYDTFTYKLCFNPKKSHSPSIDKAFTHVAILEKKFLADQDSSSSQDS